MTPEGTLPVLLGRPLAALAIEVRHAEARPPCRLELWANGLRLLADGPAPQRELRARARVSGRVTTPMFRAFAHWGWVVTEGEPRRKALRLTDRGRAVADAWRAVPGAVEGRWRADMGAGRVDRLRAALAALVRRLPLELPHYPATYGFADQTVAAALGAGMAALAAGGLKAGVDHGADWRPVVRSPGAGDPAGLPLHALLSQALVGFALDYEGEGHGPFELAATVLRHVGDQGAPLVPPVFPAGLPGRAQYTVPRFALGHVERAPGTGVDVLHLGDRGRSWRDAYGPAVGRVTAAWRASYGPDTVAEVTEAAAALAPALPPGTPDYPPHAGP